MKQAQFKKNVARYKDLIYSQAYYFTGNAEDAADITQEVLLKLWYHFEKISQHAMKCWLLKVTKNLCIDHCRQKREVTASMIAAHSSDSEFELDQMDDGLNPEEAVINLDLKDFIFKAIEKLPPLIKNVIIMREIHDLKYEEIASTLEIPINSVKVYLHRGRKLLFEYLEPFYHRG